MKKRVKSPQSPRADVKEKAYSREASHRFGGMAELADARDLGSGGLPVQVQVLLPAPKKQFVLLHGLFFYIEQHKCECKFTFERKLANKKPKICSFSKLDFGFYSPTIMFTQRY